MNVMLNISLAIIIIMLYWFLHIIMEDQIQVGRAEKIKTK
jgi:hypothetical protein